MKNVHRNFFKEVAFIICVFFLQSCNTYEGDALSIDDETGTASSVPTPVIELPPENSGEPFASTTFFDLAQLDYMKAEYFISGTANAYINSNEFARLRLGISRPTSKEITVDFVLSEFNKEEKKLLPELIQTAADCCQVWLTSGIARAMSQFNKRKSDE